MRWPWKKRVKYRRMTPDEREWIQIQGGRHGVCVTTTDYGFKMAISRSVKTVRGHHLRHGVVFSTVIDTKKPIEDFYYEVLLRIDMALHRNGAWPITHFFVDWAVDWAKPGSDRAAWVEYEYQDGRYYIHSWGNI